ncbi:hypothetical protein PROPEN_04354 [Proteus penneri ATCC 35198]|nr:hypothetical protein PROPEN_04354 [Proteus penneri ATCC 35198]
MFIASWLLFQHWQDKGIQITIDFQSASGIVSGRTPIRYQGVDVGIVKDVTLSDDLRRVIVTADVRKKPCHRITEKYTILACYT